MQGDLAIDCQWLLVLQTVNADDVGVSAQLLAYVQLVLGAVSTYLVHVGFENLNALQLPV